MSTARERRSTLVSGPVGPNNTPAFKPRSLDVEKLRGMNHGEWLEDFSRILALHTGVAMTPKREGTITRLHWAADYVKLLEQTNRDLEVEIKKLRSDAEPEAR
jgi:hypothetical protein